jgi:hypothetical protein
MPGVNRYYIIIAYTQVENVNAKLKCRNYTYPYLNVYRKCIGQNNKTFCIVYFSKIVKKS